MLWTLLLATSLVVGCQSKRDLPQKARRIAEDQASAMVIVGNQAAFARILQMRFGGGGLGAPR
jgi:hypothetical protein